MSLFKTVIMSGQPSGNPSVTRPTANGVGPGGMSSSQQRTDPQVGSSTSNGQPGSMSQSNLNSIVRQKTFMFNSIYFTSVENFFVPYLGYSSQNSRDTLSMESIAFTEDLPPLEINWAFSKLAGEDYWLYCCHA